MIASFEEYAFLQGNREADSANVRDSLRLYAVRTCGAARDPPKFAIVRGCPAYWLPIGSQLLAVRSTS